MCTFIATVLPPAADAARVGSLAKTHGLGWRELPNRHLTAQAERGSAWFATYRKQCDCGTALGSNGIEGVVPPEDPTVEVPGLKRRGWSDTKIRRWLDAKRKSMARRHRIDDAEAETTTPEVEAWITFLEAVTGSGATDRIGVLIHFYAGNMAGERIAITRRDRVAIADVTTKLLRTMESDVLYEFGSPT